MIEIEQFGGGIVRRIPETEAERWQAEAEEAKKRAEMAQRRLDVLERQYDKLEAFTTGFIEDVDRKVVSAVYATPPAQIRREAVAGRIDERTGQRVTVYREVVDWDSVDWGPPKWMPNGKRYGPPTHAEMVRPTSPRTGLPKGGGEDKPAVEHPTLLDIANRQKEIDDWHEHVDTFRRRCTKATWNLTAFGTATIGVPFLFGIANNIGLILLVLLSGLSYVGAAFCHRAKQTWKDYDACDEPLELVKWNVAENSAALKTQEPEVFLSACACPGCGDVEVHQFRKKLSIDPDWASVIRRCATCDREWAQK